MYYRQCRPHLKTGILSKRARVQFLYIHHIFKDEENSFDELFLNYHTFISHSEAVNRVINGHIDKPYISISSDDGLAITSTR